MLASNSPAVAPIMMTFKELMESHVTATGRVRRRPLNASKQPKQAQEGKGRKARAKPQQKESGAQPGAGENEQSSQQSSKQSEAVQSGNRRVRSKRAVEVANQAEEANKEQVNAEQVTVEKTGAKTEEATAKKLRKQAKTEQAKATEHKPKKCRKKGEDGEDGEKVEEGEEEPNRECDKARGTSHSCFGGVSKSSVFCDDDIGAAEKPEDADINDGGACCGSIRFLFRNNICSCNASRVR